MLPSKEATMRSASIGEYKTLLEAKKLAVDVGQDHTQLDKAIADMESKLF